jgi:hypothetical protein
MKKISIALIALAIFLITNNSSAIDVRLEPHVKGGGIKWEENGIEEGHKFMLAGGIKTIFIAESNFRGIIAAEKWQMGEGLDEDTEIPGNGYNISGEIEYRIGQSQDIMLYPYAGITFEEWERAEGNAKIPGSWDSLKFFRWTIGGKIEYKKFYARAGIMLPFEIDTNKESKLKSRPGYEAEAGINVWKKLTAGLFYKQFKFGNPGSVMNTSGVIISYQF